MTARKASTFDERLVDQLAGEIAAHLEHGSVVSDTANVGDVDRWRRAARRAGRVHGWRVRTGVTSDGARVWVLREDVEPTEEAMRDAGDVVMRAIDAGRREARRRRLRLVDDD